MTWFQSILLGVIQGISEFLPVSSSGHLMVARHYMGLGEIPILFDILMHFPTLVAVCVVFRKRLYLILAALGKGVTRRPLETEDRTHLRLVGLILLSTLVTGLLGVAASIWLPDAGLPPRVVGILSKDMNNGWLLNYTLAILYFRGWLTFIPYWLDLWLLPRIDPRSGGAKTKLLVARKC